MAEAKAARKTPRSRKKVTARKVVKLKPRDKNMLARYDAAQNGADNRRHWLNSDSLSAIQANTSAVRKTLSRRARYEMDNDVYAEGIADTLANDVIGVGPRLQIDTGDRELDRFFERKWMLWSDSIDLAGKLRTMRVARVRDGEGFALIVDNPELDGVQLDLRLIEADQVDTPTLRPSEWVEGIKFDENGNPTAYSILKNHPGGLLPGGESKTVDRTNVLHWFKMKRPGQIRGVSELTSSLNLFAQVRRWELAVLGSAETTAELTMLLKSTATDVGEGTEIENSAFTEVDIERNTMTTLPEGWDMSQIKPEQPAATHQTFLRSKVNQMGRPHGMPYNVASADSSEYNYASGRLDHQGYFKAIRVDQSHCAIHVLNRILVRWLREAMLVFGRTAPNGDITHKWLWPGTEHVDPVKEAKAQEIRLNSLTTTLAIEYGREGRDYEAALDQIQKEQQMIRDRGIIRPGATAPLPDEEQNDADENNETTGARGDGDD